MSDFETYSLSGNTQSDLIDHMLMELLDLAGDIHDDDGELVEPIKTWAESYEYDKATPELRAMLDKELVDVHTVENDHILTAICHYLEHYTIGQLALDIMLTRNEWANGFDDQRNDVPAKYRKTLNEWAESLRPLYVFHGDSAVEEYREQWAGMFHADKG